MAALDLGSRLVNDDKLGVILQEHAGGDARHSSKFPWPDIA